MIDHQRLPALAMSIASGSIQAAFRFVFPPICPLCRCELASASQFFEAQRVTPILCDDCSSAIAPKPGNQCLRCGVPIGPYLSNESGCRNCERRGFRFDRVIRFGLYDGALRAAVIRGKSPHARPLSAALANGFWLTRKNEFRSVQIDIVTAVPQYWTRRMWHDHNQSETIAAVLASNMNVRFARKLLHKVRLTPDQSDLSAADRKRNLNDAFAVWFGRNQIRGKTILLVDDILTTGTTADECAATLLRAGAHRVIVGVIAVVEPVR